MTSRQGRRSRIFIHVTSKGVDFCGAAPRRRFF